MKRMNTTVQAEVLRVHTLHNAVIKLTRQTLGLDHDVPWTAASIKEKACQGTPLQVPDLIVVQGGAEVVDEAVVMNGTGAPPCFLLVRSTATTTCTIAAKISAHGVSSSISIKVPVNMKVHALRKELYRAMSKDQMIPASAQRLVCRGQVLHDCRCIGDFLLTDKSRYNSSMHKYSLKEACNDVPDLTVFVSVSVDLSHEVPITLQMLNGKALKEYFSISTPLLYLREILWRQHRIPKDIPIYFYLPDKDTRKKQLMDETKTLYDYNIDSPVTLYMYPYMLLEIEAWQRAESPVSVASLSIKTPVSSASSSKKRSTAKCGPTKSPRGTSGNSSSMASGCNGKSKSSSSADGLFGLKKGFFSSANSSKK